MLSLVRQLRELVRQANTIAATAPGDAPRWSLFLTNKSFVAAAIAALIQIATVVSLIVPIPGGAALMAWIHTLDPAASAEAIGSVIGALLLIYSAGARLLGRTRVIWSKRQALKAIEEATAISTPAADPLQDALQDAMKASP